MNKTIKFRSINCTKFLLNAGLICVTLLSFGCSESNFRLSKESRLPVWFEIPKNMNREDFKLTMDYYIDYFGDDGHTAVFKLYSKNGKKIKKLTGLINDIYPTITDQSREGYPSYEFISVNGITEIIEHKELSDIFNIYDGELIRPRLRRN